jgi:RNA 2',3'-cyclic 3'-phosphodiesterase
MRLFTGIDLPVQVMENLDGLIRRLRPTARVKWSPVANLHITTKFIGEWPSSRLEEMKAALRQIPGTGPVPITISGVGWFPHAQEPRVLFAGVKAGVGLAQLAGDTDRAVAALGVASEQRRFSPHLTLARIKEPVPIEKLRQAAGEMEREEFGTFTAERFFLYLSDRGPSGSTYTKLEEFSLNRP